MEKMKYIKGVATLKLDSEKCVGCGECLRVCPHGVLELNGAKAVVKDADDCIECGACAMNCPMNAVSVNPGVGCAAYIINAWLKSKNIKIGSNGGCCC